MITATAPWLKTTAPETVAAVYEATLETLRVCGVLLQPFMPSKADMLLNGLGVNPEQRTMAYSGMEAGQLGEVQSGVRLFEPTRTPRQ